VISPLLANLFLHYALDVWMGEIGLICRSSGTRTISLSMAEQSGKRTWCVSKSRHGWSSCGFRSKWGT